jgi:uncharacterized protein YjbJ (UPF0337 family)
MNWNQTEGHWKQFKGNVKQQRGRLTYDHLEIIAGKRDKLALELHHYYSELRMCGGNLGLRLFIIRIGVV